MQHMKLNDGYTNCEYDKKMEPRKVLMGKRLREKRNAYGWTLKELAARMPGYSLSRISNWEQGTRGFGTEEAEALARAFNDGTTPLWFLLLDDFENIERASSPTVEIPIISYVQAGNWSEAIDNLQPGQSEGIVITTKNGLSKNTFALRVKGDSMEPEFKEGDILIVDPEIYPNAGDFVIAKIDDVDEATFKKYMTDAGKIILMPLNKSYKSFSEPDFRIRIIGVVMEKTKKYR